MAEYIRAHDFKKEPPRDTPEILGAVSLRKLVTQLKRAGLDAEAILDALTASEPRPFHKVSKRIWELLQQDLMEITR
jgi:hypothetical protein